MAFDTFPPDSRLGELEVLEPLGRGGMGAVYKAKHERFSGFLAI